LEGKYRVGDFQKIGKKKYFRYLTNDLQARLSRADMPFEKREIFFIGMNSHILSKASSVFGLKPEI
jgi:hypothetical protein